MMGVAGEGACSSSRASQAYNSQRFREVKKGDISNVGLYQNAPFILITLGVFVVGQKKERGIFKKPFCMA